ncbi:MAG: PQQ-binding-like beta-propeller repeat protein, partial [Bacteroidota bacterium]
MKLTSLFSLLILVGLSAWRPETPSPTDTTADPADSTDILSAVLALQEKMPAPSESFRPGHVNAREISDYLEKTENGFTITLPKRSLTPSPTIYKGILYVSGGFGSKEFYAFDAQTGEVLWGMDLDDDGPSSAVVENDIVVFNTESCTIFALNYQTGEHLWSYFLGDPLMSTPSIKDGIVYTAYPAGRGNIGLPPAKNIFSPSLPNQSYQNESPPKPELSTDGLQGTHVLIAMELESGKILWQKWIDGDIMSSPIVVDEELYCTTFPGTLYKLHAKTGEFLSAKASRATSAPTIVEDGLYLTQRSDKDKENVQESIGIYSRQTAGLSRGYYKKEAPYLDEKVQNETSLKELSVAYDAGNGFSGGAPSSAGAAKASANIGQSNVSSLQSYHGSRILHHEGRNYATMGDELVCSDPEKGDVIWKKKLEGDLSSSGGFLGTPPLIVNGKLIMATLEGNVMIYDADKGEKLEEYKTGESIRFQPVVYQGNIYVSTTSGKVICIKTKDTSIDGWPTWGANNAHTN